MIRDDGMVRRCAPGMEEAPERGEGGGRPGGLWGVNPALLFPPALSHRRRRKEKEKSGLPPCRSADGRAGYATGETGKQEMDSRAVEYIEKIGSSKGCRHV